MAYVRGARRHPMFRLTITPDQEEQIERELANVRRPRITDEMVGLPSASEANRPPCGTVHGYWAHQKRKEVACDPCKAGNAAFRAERRYDQKKAAA